MSRRQAREVALQALFQLDLNGPEQEAQREVYETMAVDSALSELEGTPPSDRDRAYIKMTVRGTREHLGEIDEMLAKKARGWKVGRMAVVDRNLVRLAIYEMFFAEEGLAPGIVINEAVELAKKYGTDDSGRYVNGILDALAKEKA